MSMLLLPALFFGLVPLLGCTPAPEGEGPPQGSAPLPLLVLGQGGGFTGAVEGFRLLEDGTVLRFSRPPGKSEQAARCGRLAPAQLAQLRQALAAIPWASLPQGQPGNVTSFLEVTLPSGSREIRWAGLYDDAPPPLRPLLSLVLPWLEACSTQR